MGVGGVPDVVGQFQWRRDVALLKAADAGQIARRVEVRHLPGAKRRAADRRVGTGSNQTHVATRGEGNQIALRHLFERAQETFSLGGIVTRAFMDDDPPGQGEARSQTVRARVSPVEEASIELAAKRAGKRVSDWIHAKSYFARLLDLRLKSSRVFLLLNSRLAIRVSKLTIFDRGHSPIFFSLYVI